MGLSRLILLLIIGAFAYWMWKKLTNKPQNRSSELPDSTSQMVRCSYCNVFLPQEQATQHNKKWFCCREHAKQDGTN